MPAARRTLTRAREISPTYYRVWLDSARLELNARDYAAALRFAAEGQRIKPTLTGAELIRMISRAAAGTGAATQSSTAPAP
jgi:hypothetical protein